MVDYQSLYDIYRANGLVIIFGSELLRIDGEDQTFEQKVIARVSGQYSAETGPQSYSDLAVKYPDVNSGRVTGIYSNLRQRLDVKLLQLLADLPNIRLFISTCYDPMLEQIFGARAQPMIWNHEKTESPYLDTQDKTVRKIFYLFGRMDEEVGGTLSLCEEEQVECLFRLTAYNAVNKNTTPERYSLLEYLTDKTLVFVGNNFPDWEMRILIRTLYNAPLIAKPSKAYIVNDQSARISYEKYFFEKFKIRLIHDYPIEEFLTNLHDTIRRNEEFDDWYKPKTVFISYDRRDKNCAECLKRGLNDLHVNAFLDVEDMGIAEHREKIRLMIDDPTTVIFVCVLSADLVARPIGESYTKDLEWTGAQTRWEIKKNVDKQSKIPQPFYVVPVAVDDYRPYLNELPAFIRDNNIHDCAENDLCMAIQLI